MFVGNKQLTSQVEQKVFGYGKTPGVGYHTERRESNWPHETLVNPRLFSCLITENPTMKGASLRAPLKYKQVSISRPWNAGAREMMAQQVEVLAGH